MVGPLLYQVGSIVLLGLFVAARRLPVWSPALVFIGFLAIGVNLDLIPVGAILVALGLAPFALPGGRLAVRR